MSDATASAEQTRLDRKQSPPPEFSDGRSPDPTSLDELRRLLLGPEQEALRRLAHRLDHLKLDPADVGRVLAEAVALRGERDSTLSLALIPTVEETVKASIRKDPRAFESILAPVIGQTIRSAIADAFRVRVQTFNRTLARSLSIQGLKWRWEAFRTGRSFAEVALLHSLVYRVEQVLLIHRETGLLLQHVIAEDLESVQDGDLVSGMLTAIQDFARDSFQMEDGDALETFQAGDLTVWVVQGKMALLAAVIRGEAPESFRERLKRALEEIHFEAGTALSQFDGDTDPFAAVRYCLKDCFTEEYVGHTTAWSALWTWLAVLLLLLLLVGGGLYLSRIGWLSWPAFPTGPDDTSGRVVVRPVPSPEGGGEPTPDPIPVATEALTGPDDGPPAVVRTLPADWPPAVKDYVARLAAEPGILVTELERDGDVIHITGLRDPLADRPEDLLGSAGLSAEAVRTHFIPYQTLLPEFVLKRAERALSPPAGVTLTLSDGVLAASGTAPHDWIQRAKTVAPVISGVTAFDTAGLVDAEMAALDEARQDIEATVIRFAFNTATPVPGQEARIRRLADQIRTVRRLSRRLETPWALKVVGHTDSIGTERRNFALSRMRADWARRLILENGIDPAQLTVVGVADTKPVRPERTETDRAMNRSVTFQFIPPDPISESMRWP